MIKILRFGIYTAAINFWIFKDEKNRKKNSTEYVKLSRHKDFMHFLEYGTKRKKIRFEFSNGNVNYTPTTSENLDINWLELAEKSGRCRLLGNEKREV